MNHRYTFITLILAVTLFSGCRGNSGGEGTSEPGSPSRPSAGTVQPDTGSSAPGTVETALPDTAAINRTWNEARRRGAEFRATGNEPGWYLEIFQSDSIVLVADYGERRIVTPTPEPMRADSLLAYQARTGSHQLAVMIEPHPCTDSMNGMRFPSTVTVILDGHTYRGCGRDL